MLSSTSISHNTKMSSYRPGQQSDSQHRNMYDDQPYEEGSRRSQGYEISGHDNSRPSSSRPTPRKPAAADLMHNSDYKADYFEDNSRTYDRNRRRSRSPRRERRGHYTDRDSEGYKSPRRSRSRSRSPYFGGPPTRTVILEGIPIGMAQGDISNELQHRLHVEGLEEVRLIKDKKTGQSRQFAFAQFATTADATRLLEQYYPTLPLYGAYDPNQSTTSQPAKVRIAYSREREDRDSAGKGEDDWKCDVCHLPNYSHRTICFRCNAPRTRSLPHGISVAQANMSSFSGFATTGDSDASPDDTASQFLLLRSLEPGVNEDLLAKGVSKLYRTKASTPPRDNHTGKKTKIASTSNDSSFGAKEGSLRRVLLIRDRKTNDSWRYGFAEFNTVEDAQAAVAKYKVSEKFTISSKPVLVSYIHAGVFVPVLHPMEGDSSRFAFSPLSNSAVKLMYWDEAAYANELVTAVIEPVTNASRKENEHAKRAAAAANEGLVNSGREGESRAKKRKVEKETKVVAPHLQFWSNRHAEIHGIPSKESEDTLTDDSQLEEKPKAEEDRASLSTQSFADEVRKCCLLCSRQFKSDVEVEKHERSSQLHRNNLQNDELVAKALSKLNKSTEKDNNSSYRDRAKERRQAFHQPKRPAPQHHRSSKSSAVEDASKKGEDSSEPPVASKGAALLGKMGWTAGEGLGAQGTGRTDAITTDLYSAGVGLGAQGGKLGDAVEEAQRQTTGSYADFLNKTKEKAKERFASLG